MSSASRPTRYERYDMLVKKKADHYENWKTARIKALQLDFDLKRFVAEGNPAKDLTNLKKNVDQAHTAEKKVAAAARAVESELAVLRQSKEM